jgi:hypothetical protein
MPYPVGEIVKMLAGDAWLLIAALGCATQNQGRTSEAKAEGDRRGYGTTEVVPFPILAESCQ